MKEKMPILEFRNIEKRFDNEVIFKNVNLKIYKGEVISLIGKSGSGKSTMLRCINLLEKLDNGDILLEGKNINDVKLVELRQNIGIVFQDYNLFDNMSVIDNLIVGLTKIKKYNKIKSTKLALEMLKRVGLIEKKDKYPDELSGGQKQRVAIARTLLMKPKVILFDEPTSALDSEMKEEVQLLIKELVKDDMTLIIVSHEENFVNTVSDKIYKISNKKFKEVLE